MMMTMNADAYVIPAERPSARRAKIPTLTCEEAATRALRAAGAPDDSQQPLVLTRYAELKRASAETLQQWLDRFVPEQMITLRFLLETCIVDCEGELNALTAHPYLAAPGQMKFVQQYGGDGVPLWRFKLPRLNTVDAIDDALSAEALPMLRGAGDH